MDVQERFRNLKGKLGIPFGKQSNLAKPFTKRRKLGEDEVDWCDALDHSSVYSDSDIDGEYVDAPEQRVISKSLPTGRKRMKAQSQTPSGNKLEKNSEMFQPYTSSASGMGSRRPHERKIEQYQVSHALYLSVIYFCLELCVSLNLYY